MRSWRSLATQQRLVALMVAIGGAFVVWEGMRYSFGTLARIGPGFLPVVIGIGIAAIGLALVARGSDVETEQGPALRPLILVTGAILTFAVALERFGIVPATVAMTLVAAIAEPRVGVRSAIAIVALVLAIAVGLFHFGFGIPVPLFRWPA
jgi:hypothetical protein